MFSNQENSEVFHDYDKYVEALYNYFARKKQYNIRQCWAKNRKQIENQIEDQKQYDELPSSWVLHSLQSAPDLSPAESSQAHYAKVKSTLTLSTDSGDEKEVVTKEKTFVIEMPKVKTNPPYSCWVRTPRSCIVPDHHDRSHLPYFDDATIGENNGILKELEEFRDEDERDDNEDVFYDTVMHLKRVEVKSTKTKGDDLNSSNDAFLKSEEALRTPSMTAFRALCLGMKSSSSATTLREKFLTLLKKFENSNKDIGVDLDIDTIQNQTPQTAEQSLDSFKQLFCRKCFIYNCLFHMHDGIASEDIPKQKSATSTAFYQEPCAPSCFRHDFNDSDMTLGQTQPETWEPNDISLFRVLRRMFKDNYCHIADILLTDCRKVKQFAEMDKEAGHVTTSPDSCRLPFNSQKPKGNRQSIRNVCPKGFHANKNFVGTIYKPCCHPGMECLPATCSCLVMKIPCEKYCTCLPNCVHRAVGCKCVTRCSKRNCPCFAAQRECDPDLCTACGANQHSLESTTCRNIGIQRGWSKLLKMAESTIPAAGWGIFAGESITKGELIAEYTGDLITDEEADRRALVDKKRCHTFLFELNSERTIDAKMKGSKIRFANHADKQNTDVRMMKVNTDQRLGVYAARDISKDEEIFLSYKNVIDEHQGNWGKHGSVDRHGFRGKTIPFRKNSSRSNRT